MHLKTVSPVASGQPNHTPARRIDNRGGGTNHIGEFYSRKNEEHLRYESRLERDLCFRLESIPEVTSYRPQPFRLPLALDNKLRVTTPDFEVFYIDHTRELIEVKYASVASRDDFRKRADAVRNSAHHRGYTYRVVTEREIRRQPQLSNAKTLVRYARFATLAHRNTAVQKIRENGGTIQWGAIHPKYLAGSAAAILDGLLTYDTSEVFGCRTSIAIVDEVI